MAEMIRVNTRISKKLNDWLDEQSDETGIPKSTFVMLALENYYQQRTASEQLNALGVLVEKLEALDKKIDGAAD